MGGFKQRPEFHLINVFTELTQCFAGGCDQRDESAGAGEFFLVGGLGGGGCCSSGLQDDEQRSKNDDGRIQDLTRPLM